jgi:hypothetical protein
VHRWHLLSFGMWTHSLLLQLHWKAAVIVSLTDTDGWYATACTLVSRVDRTILPNSNMSLDVGRKPHFSLLLLSVGSALLHIVNPILTMTFRCLGYPSTSRLAFQAHIKSIYVFCPTCTKPVHPQQVVCQRQQQRQWPIIDVDPDSSISYHSSSTPTCSIGIHTSQSGTPTTTDARCVVCIC